MSDLAYTSPDSHYEYVSETRESVAMLKKEAYACMDEVDGWCSRQKASILIDIMTAASPEKIVEIGVWGGKSLLPMAYTLKKVGKGKIYGIDPWENRASLEGLHVENSIEFWALADHAAVLSRLTDVIQEYQLEEYVELIATTSLNAPLISDIDILHIDGNHSDAASYIDVTKWVPLVKKGGWIIFDDINWIEKGAPTTKRAVEYLQTHCHKIAEIDELCLWGIWYKP